MIKKLSLTFGSKTKAQEMILLLQNAKEVVRHGYLNSELHQVEQFCQKNNLHLVKSTYKVLFADDGVYSNQGIRVPDNDRRPGMYFVYISKDEQKAWLASYYELMLNHKDLGMALGYPPCCITFFMSNFSKNPNPQHAPRNPYTNLSKREQDLVILSHFPCRSDCKESIKLGEKYFQALYAVDKDHARELFTQLRVK